jgi:hypothetical protein
MKPKKAGAGTADASRRIDESIGRLADWRGERLAEVRRVIRGADRAIIEEWKWDIPVWSCEGILCTGETYKDKIKLTFAQGASLKDPARLFNSSLDGKVRRAIDIRATDTLDARALAELIRAAVALNRG